MELDFFYAKRALDKFLYPQHFWVLVTLIAFLAWRWRPRTRIGLWLFLAGAVWMLVTSCPIVGFLLVHSLEDKVGPLVLPNELVLRNVHYVVVLGPNEDGVKLWRKFPGTKLVLSSMGCAVDMAKEARRLGVPDKDVVLETKGRDTQEQDRALQPLLRNEPFILSTYAFHMPRTLLTFRAMHMHPIPAPVGRVQEPESLGAAFWPSTKGWLLTKAALHEYVGAMWFRLKWTVLSMVCLPSR